MTRRLVLWEGRSWIDDAPVVLIGTRALSPSVVNRKTGDIVHTWILRSDRRPAEAWREGQDASVCGDCKLRGDPEDPGSRSCYVHLGHLGNLWNAYRAGSIPYLTEDRQLAGLVGGRVVRIGSYGDPLVLPFDVIRTIISPARAHIGYTHLWRHPGARGKRHYRQPLMASVDTEAEQVAARAAGWRTFRTTFRSFGAPKEPPLGDEIVCPASDEAGHLSTCERCRLCNGVQKPRHGVADRRRSIVIQAHHSPNAYATMRSRLAIVR
jgi:hypothetical protein